MFILLINTVWSPNGIFLFSVKGKCLAQKTWKKAQSHSEKLFPAIESVFKKAKKTWRDLSAIYVVNGPGPFTSLRVGIAVANSAGFALQIPVYSAPNVIPDRKVALATAPDQESLNHIFSQYLASKLPKINKKNTFQPVSPIYGREPNISKPRSPLTVMTPSVIARREVASGDRPTKQSP
ncbi:tRNA (adenosine(37)-N6)-threonylcarbamoyltransferase complex dimerization subunit type 1 TsaB [Candidatus Peregrinibacteria bacterium]|nr:tRNA (adenosine(37)-N6)-threonylcarbamoyltransferase complex dimerization subunit type 1 TsaB [Candidatus Peregrinibacteria bacterium]